MKIYWFSTTPPTHLTIMSDIYLFRKGDDFIHSWSFMDMMLLIDDNFERVDCYCAKMTCTPGTFPSVCEVCTHTELIGNNQCECVICSAPAGDEFIIG